MTDTLPGMEDTTLPGMESNTLPGMEETPIQSNTLPGMETNALPGRESTETRPSKTLQNIRTAKKFVTGLPKEAYTLVSSLGSLVAAIPTVVINATKNKFNQFENLKEVYKNTPPETRQQAIQQVLDAQSIEDTKATKEIISAVGKSIWDSYTPYAGWDPVTKEFRFFEHVNPDTGEIEPSVLRTKLEDDGLSVILDAASILQGVKYISKLGKVASNVPPTSTVEMLANKVGKDTQIGRQLIDFHLSQQTKAILASAQEQTVKSTSRVNEGLVKYIGKLDDTEKAKFAEIVHGITPFPEKGSQTLRDALSFWKHLNGKEQSFLIGDAGRLTQESVEHAKFIPSLVKKLGKPIDIVDSIEDKTKVSEYLQLTSSEVNSLIKDLKSEMKFVSSVKTVKPGEFVEPFYFPFMKKQEGIGISKAFSKKEPGFLKQRTGASYLQDTWEKDPLKVLVQHNNQVAKLRSVEGTVNDIVSMPTTIPYLGGKIPDGMKLFAPDDYIKFNKVQLATTGKFLNSMDEIGDIDLAAADAVKSTLLPQLPGLKATGKMYLVPDPVADTIRGLFTSKTNNAIKLIYDKPMEYWKFLVLQARPKWLVSNTIGNTIYSAVAGTKPSGVIKAVEPGINKVIPASLFESVHASMGSGIPPRTALGKYSNFVKMLNTEEDFFFKKSLYLTNAEKLAKQKLVLETGKKTFSANEITRRIAQLDKTDPLEVAKMTEYVNDFLPNFKRMSEFERDFVRKVVPFWSFIKHQIKLDAKLVYKYPVRTNVIDKLTDAAEAMTPEAYRDNFKKGRVFIGKDNVTLPNGVQVPIDRYIDTKSANPFIPGASLSALSPFITVPIEYMMNREMYTGKKFSSPYAMELSDGTYLKYDNLTKQWEPTNHPMSLGEYAVQKLVPQAQLVKKAIEAERPVEGKSILKVYRHKDLPEMLLNWFIINTYIENPPLEAARKTMQDKAAVSALRSKLKSSPELLQKLKENPDFIKSYMNELKLRSDKGRQFPDQVGIA